MQHTYNYLIVDDEKSIVKVLTDMLKIHPSVNCIYSASDGSEALEIIQNNKIDILFTDILMPRLSGDKLIKEVRRQFDDTQLQIVVISAFSDIKQIQEAIHNGAYDYILKPFSLDDILNMIKRVVERIHLLEQKQNYLEMLERKVEEATRERNKAFFNSFKAMVLAIDARDKYTHKHSENVADYAVQIGKLLSLDSEQLENLKIAGILHDIGKIGIPDKILCKNGPLTEQEFDVIRTHPTLGKNIVEPTMKNTPDIIRFVYEHHERFDGKGYPRGLKQEEISLFARIANIADSFDTITSARVYKQAMPLDQAIEEVKRNLGGQFDPEIGKIFIDSF